MVTSLHLHYVIIISACKGSKKLREAVLENTFIKGLFCTLIQNSPWMLPITNLSGRILRANLIRLFQ